MDDLSTIAYAGILVGAWLAAGIGSALILASALSGIKEKNLEDNQDDS